MPSLRFTSLNATVMASQDVTSAKEVTALLKNRRSEMKGMQEKEPIMCLRGR